MELWQRCGDSPKRVGGSIPHHRWVWPSLAGARGRTVQLCQWARRRLQKAGRGSRAAARQRPVQCRQVGNRPSRRAAPCSAATSYYCGDARGGFFEAQPGCAARLSARSTRVGVGLSQGRRWRCRGRGALLQPENVRPCSGGSTGCHCRIGACSPHGARTIIVNGPRAILAV